MEKGEGGGMGGRLSPKTPKSGKKSSCIPIACVPNTLNSNLNLISSLRDEKMCKGEGMTAKTKKNSHLH